MLGQVDNRASRATETSVRLILRLHLKVKVSRRVARGVASGAPPNETERIAAAGGGYVTITQGKLPFFCCSYSVSRRGEGEDGP